MFLFKSRFSGVAAALPSRETIERGRAAVIDGANAAVAAAERLEAGALAGRGKRGSHRVALTVAAVGVTAVAATAAYVWWKRRGEAAEAREREAASSARSYSWTTPAAPTAEAPPEQATAHTPMMAQAPEPVSAPAEPVVTQAWSAAPWTAPVAAPAEAEADSAEPETTPAESQPTHEPTLAVASDEPAIAAAPAEPMIIASAPELPQATAEPAFAATMPEPPHASPRTFVAEPPRATVEPTATPSAILEPAHRLRALETVTPVPAPIDTLSEAPAMTLTSMAEASPTAAVEPQVAAPMANEPVAAEPTLAPPAAAPTSWAASPTSYADAVAAPPPASATSEAIPAWLVPGSPRATVTPTPPVATPTEPPVAPRDYSSMTNASLREALLSTEPAETSQPYAGDEQAREEPIAQATPELIELPAEPEAIRAEQPATPPTQSVPAPAASSPAPAETEYHTRSAARPAPSSPFGQRFMAPATRPTLPSRKVGLP